MPSQLKGFRRRAAGHVAEREVFENEDLSLLFAPGARFTGCVFVGCRIDMATFNGATLDTCAFRDVSMVGTSFRGAMLKDTTFRGHMTGASFEGATIDGCLFESCEMQGASFFGAQVRGETVISKSSLRDADLRYYECDAGRPVLSDVDLRGAAFAVNCEFWNQTFDARAIADFGRVYARASRDPELIAMAKERFGTAEYESVDRYMRRPR